MKLFQSSPVPSCEGCKACECRTGSMKPLKENRCEVTKQFISANASVAQINCTLHWRRSPYHGITHHITSPHIISQRYTFSTINFVVIAKSKYLSKTLWVPESPARMTGSYNGCRRSRYRPPWPSAPLQQPWICTTLQEAVERRQTEDEWMREKMIGER